MWHPKQQMDVNGNSNSSLTRIQSEVSWFSSHSNVPKRLSQDMTEEGRSVSARSTLLDNTRTQPIKFNNGLPPHPVEEGNKVVERTGSFRLFGIELISHSTSLPSVEKSPVQLSISSRMAEGNVRSISSAAESDKNSDFSKCSKENKHVQVPLLSKDLQAKQNSASSRSRTKVRIAVICSCHT